MGILQGGCYLPDVRDDGLEGEPRLLRVALTQGATRRIFHNQKWRAFLHPKIQHAHNMRMPELGKLAGLAKKAFFVSECQRFMEYFDGRLGVQMPVLCQIDRRPMSLPKQLGELIVAQELADMVGHIRTSSAQQYSKSLNNI
jgi:hypothetical protein